MKIQLLRSDITELAVDAIVNTKEIAIKTIIQYPITKTGIEKVIFVCFDEDNYSLYKTFLPDLST